MFVVKIVLGIMFWVFSCFVCWVLIRGGTMNDNEEDLDYEQDRANKS